MDKIEIEYHKLEEAVKILNITQNNLLSLGATRKVFLHYLITPQLADIFFIDEDKDKQEIYIPEGKKYKRLNL